MSVPDASVFKTDIAAQDAVKEGIAAVADCVVSYITLSIKMASETTGRRLADSVVVTYTITIPGTASANPNDALAKLKAATTAELTTKISEKITLAKGAGYPVSVTTKSTPSESKRATCDTIATVPLNFCGSGKVYDSSKAVETCAAATCSKTTGGDVTACCKASDESEVSSTSETSLVGEILLVGVLVVHVANSFHYI
jgi:hypothetical protein